MAKPDEFSETRVIIAEGYEDAVFVEQLIRTRARRLSSFDVWSNEELGKVGGNSGFVRSVAAADIKRGFSAVTDVIFLADNDDLAATSFDNVCTQIRVAKKVRNWAIPPPGETKQAGDPSVAIWMFPAPGEEGCLETLLWTAITSQRQHAANVACVEAACRCSGADQWSRSKLDKARVRAFLSLVCKKNPSVSFQNLWRDFPNLIPMGHSAFTPIADFLRSI